MPASAPQPAKVCINEKQRHDLVTRLTRLGYHTDEAKYDWLLNAGINVNDLREITVLDYHREIVPALKHQEPQNIA